MVLTVSEMDSTWYVKSSGISMPMCALEAATTIVPIKDAMDRIGVRTPKNEWVSKLDAIQAAYYLTCIERYMKEGATLDQAFSRWAAQFVVGELLKNDQIPITNWQIDWNKLAVIVRNTVRRLRDVKDASESL